MVMKNLTELSSHMVKMLYRSSVPGHMEVGTSTKRDTNNWHSSSGPQCKDILEPATHNVT